MWLRGSRESVSVLPVCVCVHTYACMYMTHFKALKMFSATPFKGFWALGDRYGGLKVVHLIFFMNFRCERTLQGPKRIQYE